MSNQVNNKIDKATGKVKETVGSLTDDEELEEEGRSEQRDANLKEAGRTMKDAAKKAAEDVQEAFDR